jgi:hypothetical protein
LLPLYDFTVVLINDSIIKDKGRINIYDSVHSPDGMKISGVPNDSCWLFKTEIGKVNLFSCIAEPNTEMITAMQVGNEAPVEKLDK